MADPKISATLQRLDQLTPEARQRVEDALKTQIEHELTASAAGPTSRGEFSRGIIFSRSRPKAMLDQEQEVMRQAATMDEASFAKFAKNIGQLKAAKGSGS